MKTTPVTLLVMLVSLANVGFAQLALAATDPGRTQPTGEPNLIETQVASPVASVSSATRFERLDMDGNGIADSETWSCVADRQTSLVWEVKTLDGGMRDTTNSFTWFDPELDTQAGAEDGGRCSGGVKCDTHHYRISLNQQRLCGFNDWRLPSREELETLVKFQTNKSLATIDENLFPVAAASWYWTASANHSDPRYAWYVLFRNGIPLNDLKTRPKHVRLVRGGKLPVASN